MELKRLLKELKKRKDELREKTQKCLRVVSEIIRQPKFEKKILYEEIFFCFGNRGFSRIFTSKSESKFFFR